tara:strand:- start:995 stop:1369 length:375 start_codon:yes stop_codon:yes gene_type:complete
MSETKELLEATVKGLEEKINQLADDLTSKRKELADISKTKITGELYEEIGNAIEDAVEGFNFDDTDAYEFEFGMEYDGKVYIESVGMQSTYELTNSIMNKIDQRFNVLPLSTEENTVTEIKKVI